MTKELEIVEKIRLEDWEIFNFGEICKFVRGPFGGSLKKSIFKESGFAVYEQKHAIYDRFDNVRYFVDEEKFNEMKRFELNSGDLIMSCSGTIGKIAIVPDNIQRGIINQALLILSPNNKVLNIFLKLWLQSENFQDSLKKYTKGAAIKNVVSVKILKNIEIPLPPLPQQRQVVAVLDKAFTAIDIAKANAEQNLQNAKELFESYLQNIFENKGDDWEEKTLGEVCEINPKKSEVNKFPDNHLVSFLPMKDLGVVQRHINPNKIKQLSEVKGGYTYFRNDDVLLAKVTPCFENGKLGIAKNLKNEIGFGSSEYIVFRSQNIISPEYLFYILSSNKFRNKGKELMFGATGLKRLSKDYVQNFSAPVPTIDEQLQLVQKLDSLALETKKLEAIYIQKISDLEEMKKSVLQKVFSGQLNTIN